MELSNSRMRAEVAGAASITLGMFIRCVRGGLVLVGHYILCLAVNGCNNKFTDFFSRYAEELLDFYEFQE